MAGANIAPQADDGVNDALYDMPFDRAVKTARDAIEQRLTELLAFRPPNRAGVSSRLDDSMSYAVLGGGKRLRALLVLLAADMVEGRSAVALQVAAAVEFVHAQSLAHDDLPCMDDDDWRRGKPSVHRAFDEATAVLCGDALLALAFEVLADERAHPDPLRRLQLIAEMGRSIGRNGLALGQMLDLTVPPEASAEWIEGCAGLKTGNLFEFSLYAGALIASDDDEKAARLARFGRKLGIAFQVSDDLLDRLGDEGQVGKRLNRDAGLGRRTAIDVWGIEGARLQLRQIVSEAHAQLDWFGGRARHIHGILDLVAGRVS